jgi:hypothetical protein
MWGLSTKLFDEEQFEAGHGTDGMEPEACPEPRRDP